MLIRAFTAARSKSKPTNEFSADYVTRNEYRWLLKYLHMYYEMWVAFEAIDIGSDRRISLNEFKHGLGMLQKWNVDVSDP